MRRWLAFHKFQINLRLLKLEVFNCIEMLKETTADIICFLHNTIVSVNLRS